MYTTFNTVAICEIYKIIKIVHHFKEILHMNFMAQALLLT